MSRRGQNEQSERPLKASGSNKKRKKKPSVKDQLRSLQRVLAKEGMSYKARRAVEAKIEALKAVHQEHKQSEKDREMAVRYHRVKFFERVKLERRIDTLSKKIKQEGVSEEEKDAAAALLAQSTEDLQYVLNFPKGEKYVSLLKEAANPEAQAALDEERDRLTALVRQRVADQIMLSEVNEGVLNSGDLRAEESLQVDGSNASPPMPSAKGPLESTAKPAKRAVDAEATRSLSSPPLKKLNKEAKALEPRTAHGNLAVEDDFFLEDTAQVSDASLSPILPNSAREDVAETQGNIQQEGSRPLANFRPLSTKARLKKAVIPRAAKHARPPNMPTSLQQAAADNGKARWNSVGSIRQGTMNAKASVETTVQKRTRAEGGRKRRKKSGN